MTWRDTKREARKALHDVMQIAGLYLTYAPLDSNSPEPLPVTVRVHTSFKALGDQAGTSFAFAEREEAIPRLIFLRSQVSPIRGAVVSIADGEAYRVMNVLPPDDITITTEATRLSPAETLGLPLPEAS